MARTLRVICPRVGAVAPRRHETELGRTLRGIARRRGANGFTFDDLARGARLRGATIGQVADWLACNRTHGRVEDLGFDHGPQGAGGPRRYRLAG
jgi:hypothetical protein